MTSFAQNHLGAAQVSYTYTASGKRQTMTGGTTTYTYDPVTDRLITKQTPFGGAAMTYTYDELNRLKTVTAPGQQPTTYAYDENGDLAGYTYPNGISTSYAYDALNRLIQMTLANERSAGLQPGGPNLLAQYTYELGKSGNRTSVTELNGRKATYGYDDLYRLTSETITAAAGGTFSCGSTNGRCGSIGYTYDPVGNRKLLSSTLAAIPASGLLNYDANDRTATDTYDDNGNTVNQAGIENQYDFENHLIKHGEVTVVYDGDGNRVSETAGGVTTQYLVDTLNPTGYAQVIDELQSGSVVRSYTWGLQLIALNQTLETGNWKLETLLLWF